MSTALLSLGVVCVIGAIVGGGLKAMGTELPTLASTKRQVMLGVFGVVLILAGLAGLGGSTDGKSNSNQTENAPVLNTDTKSPEAPTDSKTNQQNSPTVQQNLPALSNTPPRPKDIWTDSDTGLSWAMRDNGSDINWADATKYCSALRLDGYSNWRLPSVQEGRGIYELNRMYQVEDSPIGHNIKGNIVLTGAAVWSSDEGAYTAPITGVVSTGAFLIDFTVGRPATTTTKDHSWFSRALCVRQG